MLIEITQEDIDKGCPGNSSLCAVARAIERVTTTRPVKVCADADERIQIGSTMIDCPHEVNRFTWAYDTRGPESVKPFEFELTYEENR